MEDFNKNQRVEAGQTLIEILLAFSVSILVLSAIVVGITTSLSNTQYTKNQNLANSYAQEGMAVVRQIRDSSWPNFSSYTTNITYCLGPNPMGLTPLAPPALNCGAQSPVGGIFSREVTIVHYKDDISNGCAAGTPTPPPVGTGGSKVTVRVSWADSKCPAGTGNPLCHNVELITCFSSIDLKPTP